MPEYAIGNHRGRFVLTYRTADGRRVRTSLGTDDRGIAEARAGQIWAQITAPRSERVEDLWPAYVRERKAAGAVSDRFTPTWKALAPHFGHRLGTAITRDDCRVYHAERRKLGRSNSTVKTELDLLAACLNQQLGDKAPTLWKPPTSAPRDRYLTRPELDALLAAIETPHVRLFVILGVTTGARMSALLDLTWDRVDFARGTIDLNPPGRHKTNKRRTIVPMNSRARAALEEAAPAALTGNVIEWAGEAVASVKKAIRMAAKRSGVPCSPHVLRHTAGVWAAEAGVPMTVIAQFLGHTNTRVTESVYARFSPGYMKSVADALDF